MPDLIPFIGREEELGIIDSRIKEKDSFHIVWISGSGGNGKTCLLQEIYRKFGETLNPENYVWAPIVDFDKRDLHVAENLGIELAYGLDKSKFYDFLEQMDKYRELENKGISQNILSEKFEEGTSTFIQCLNNFSKDKRCILLFDTIEKIEGTDYLKYLFRTFSQLENCVILIAGRNAKEINEQFGIQSNKKSSNVIDLPPFTEEYSEEYLQKLGASLESEVSRKIITLSEGRPIILKLAVDWLTSESITSQSFKEILEGIDSLNEDELAERKKKFERQLVLDIVQLRSKIDRLILWLSRLYPLDVKAAAKLLCLPENETELFFKKAQTYAFIKTLPDKSITLHDVMRDMVHEHVWPEIDPEGGRRKYESRIIKDYLENKIQKTVQKIQQEIENKNSFRRIPLERYLWVLKAQYLEHCLYIDIDQGVETFIALFEEATEDNYLNSREMLVIQVQPYFKELSPEQRYKFNVKRVVNWQYKSSKESYSEAKNVIIGMLNEDNNILADNPQEHIELLILLGNIEVRLGQVKEGIESFEKALALSENSFDRDERESHLRLVRSYNALGWANRIIGYFKKAEELYKKARHLCLEVDGLNDDVLKKDYGWISNNLAFVLSNTHATRLTAVDLAHSTITHWQSIEDHKVGLGAAYHVLGVAHYRSNYFDMALRSFQDALDIFQPLKYKDWLGQIYSWRGALHFHAGRLDEAERDLKEALQLGSENIEAMTHNRLGRVYMARRDWERAKKEMEKSLEHAKEIPDYIYWLGSIARLATIAAEEGKFERLNEFQKELEISLKIIGEDEADQSSLGIAYVALARLALGQKDIGNTSRIINYLKKGIPGITENGPYAEEGILKRLNIIEKGIADLSPSVVQSIGTAMKEFVEEKEKENIAYSALIPMMNKWASWKK